MRLAAPGEGAALIAGSMAELEWAPLAGFAGFQDVEEWEAFLSVDGGVVAAESLGVAPRSDLLRAGPGATLFVSGPEPPQLRDSLQGNGAAVDAPTQRGEASARASADPPVSSDILLLTQRQNE